MSQVVVQPLVIENKELGELKEKVALIQKQMQMLVYGIILLGVLFLFMMIMIIRK